MLTFKPFKQLSIPALYALLAGLFFFFVPNAFAGPSGTTINATFTDGFNCAAGSPVPCGNVDTQSLFGGPIQDYAGQSFDCWAVLNTSSFDIFVPTRTQAEFESFLRAVTGGNARLMADGVTAEPCCDVSKCVTLDGDQSGGGCAACIDEGHVGAGGCCDWFCPGPSDDSSTNPNGTSCCRDASDTAVAPEIKADGTCPSSVCGDAWCSVGEDVGNCCEDCAPAPIGFCAGNSQCCGGTAGSFPETTANCCQDCGFIDNDTVCSTSCGENCATSPNDCACTAPETCAGDCAATPGLCGCCPESDAAFCSRYGKNCDNYTNTDNCGNSRTANCGTCTSPEICGGGGISNVCGCTPAKTCASEGYNCETFIDDCGNPQPCGTCTAPDSCGGGGIPNVCGNAGGDCVTWSEGPGTIQPGLPGWKFTVSDYQNCTANTSSATPRFDGYSSNGSTQGWSSSGGCTNGAQVCLSDDGGEDCSLTCSPSGADLVCTNSCPALPSTGCATIDTWTSCATGGVTMTCCPDDCVDEAYTTSNSCGTVQTGAGAHGDSYSGPGCPGGCSGSITGTCNNGSWNLSDTCSFSCTGVVDPNSVPCSGYGQNLTANRNIQMPFCLADPTIDDHCMRTCDSGYTYDFDTNSCVAAPPPPPACDDSGNICSSDADCCAGNCCDIGAVTCVPDGDPNCTGGGSCSGSSFNCTGQCDANCQPTGQNPGCLRVSCNASTGCTAQVLLSNTTNTVAVLWSGISGSGSPSATSWTRSTRSASCGNPSCASSPCSGSGDPSNIGLYSEDDQGGLGYCPPNVLSTQHSALSAGQDFDYTIGGVRVTFTCEADYSCSGSVPNSANCSGYGSALTSDKTETAVGNSAGSCPAGGDHCAVYCVNGYTASGGTCVCNSCIGWNGDPAVETSTICCDGGDGQDCTTCSDDSNTYCTNSQCTGSSTCPGAEASCGLCDNGQCDNTVRNGCNAGTANDGAYADTAAEWRWRCDATAAPCTNSGMCSKAKASCSNDTINNCDVTATSSGNANGSCASGYTGSCSYTCNNGNWTTPSSNSCKQNCSSPCGTIAHNDTCPAYQNATEDCASDCTANSQIRTCTDGTLSGSYTNASCSQTCGAYWCDTSKRCANISGCDCIATSAGGAPCTGMTVIGPCGMGCNDDDYCHDAGSPINGVCNNCIRNGCTSGTQNDGAYADTSTEYRWRCDGQNGGTNSGMCSKCKCTTGCDTNCRGADPSGRCCTCGLECWGPSCPQTPGEPFYCADSQGITDCNNICGVSCDE